VNEEQEDWLWGLGEGLALIVAKVGRMNDADLDRATRERLYNLETALRTAQGIVDVLVGDD